MSPLRRFARATLLAAFANALAVPALAQDLPGLGAPETESEPPSRTIASTHSAADDELLAKRLSEIFAQVEGLATVEVEVSAGVVRLSGEVLSSAAHDKAVNISNQVHGVVEVQDQIEEAVDLDRRLRPVVDDLRDRAQEMIGTVPLFGVAVAVFALFWGLGRLLTAWEAPFRRVTRSGFTSDLLRQALRAVFVITGAVVALQILDATTVVAAVAGVAGLAGLALSFAFRDLVENYIASVLLSLRQPFLANEHVVIDGNEGHVVRLTSRATILLNPDGNHVRIPNAAVFKATILNYTRNPFRRFGFEVGVAADSDLGAAVNLGRETLERMPGVLSDPAPQSWVQTLGDWCVVLSFFGWVDQRDVDWNKARGEAMRLVKECFDAAGIVMPEPTVRTLAIEAAARSAEAADGSEPVAVDLAIDLAPETQIEDAIADDRAASGDDLLDESTATE